MYFGSILFLIPLFVAALLFMLSSQKFERAFSVCMSVLISFMAVIPIAYRVAVSYALKHRKPSSNKTVVVFVNGVPVGGAKGNGHTLLTIFLVFVFTAVGVAALYGIAFLFRKITKDSVGSKAAKVIHIIAAIVAGLDAVYIVAISYLLRKPIGNIYRTALRIKTQFGWTGFQPVTGMLYGAIILFFSVIAVLYVREKGSLP